MSERVIVFVDGSNLYRSVLKAFSRRDLDIGKLVTKLAAGRNFIQAYYYTAPFSQAEDPEGARQQQRFFTALTWIHQLELRLGTLARREIEYNCQHCGKKGIVRHSVQKGVDTRLSVDLVTLAVRDAYDVGIVVSGDSDYVEAIRFVKEHPRKQIVNAFPLPGWAPELRAIADFKTTLDESFLDDCWLKPREAKN